MNLWPITNIELQNYVNLLSYKLNKICVKLVFNGNKFTDSGKSKKKAQMKVADKILAKALLEG